MSRATASSSIPARVLRALPRPPWTERRADSFDNSDLAGLTRAQLWAKKRGAEDALFYLLSRGRDHFAWPPYLDSPGSAIAWLEHRIAACQTAMRAADR
jgi:hypothetical protein